jgi:hypothetical protein
VMLNLSFSVYLYMFFLLWMLVLVDWFRLIFWLFDLFSVWVFLYIEMGFDFFGVC